MKNKTEIRYKFLNGSESEHGNHKWRLNKWHRIEGELKMCPSKEDVKSGMGGFHCSRHIQDALRYVNGDTLAFVEVRGKSQLADDKECWEEMRVIKRFKFKKEHAVRMAIFSAKLCLSVFEDTYPDDKRVREAIEASEKYVNNPTEKNRQAAMSAESAAWSAAMSAESAAWSAAWSAESAAMSAARSAESAAMSAAWSAESAAMSAESATRSAVKDKIHDYVLSLFEVSQ